jgi:hypothetical protein
MAWMLLRRLSSVSTYEADSAAANQLKNNDVDATDAKKRTQSGDDDDAFSAQLAALRAENERVYAAARKAKK